MPVARSETRRILRASSVSLIALLLVATASVAMLGATSRLADEAASDAAARVFALQSLRIRVADLAAASRSVLAGPEPAALDALAQSSRDAPDALGMAIGRLGDGAGEAGGASVRAAFDDFVARLGALVARARATDPAARGTARLVVEWQATVQPARDRLNRAIDMQVAAERTRFDIARESSERAFRVSDAVAKALAALSLVTAAITAVVLRRSVRALLDADLRAKASGQSLREAEERARLVVEGAREHAIFLLDVRGTIASWNAGGERMLGWTEAEVLGRPLSDLYATDDPAGGCPARALGLATLHGHHAEEVRLRARDGRRFWAACTLTAVSDPEGVPRGCSVVIRDVSERHALETRLRESNERIAAERELALVTLRAIGDGVIVADASGRVQQLNDAAAALTGWTEAEARGHDIADVYRVVSGDAREPLDAVTTALRELRVVEVPDDALLVARDGREVAVQESAAPIRLPDGRVLGAVVVFNDVTESRRLLHDVRWQATHDALTGLTNRREFESRLARLIDRPAHPDAQHAMLMIDLDRFKAVNDACGHPAGDRLLVEVSRLFDHTVRERDTLARLGGDEFAVILEHCDLDHARQVGDKLLQAARAYCFVHEERVFRIGTSIGLVPFPSGGASVEEVMRLADAALYAAKERGKDRVVVQRPGEVDVADPVRETGFLDRLERAIREDRLHLCMQPIVSVAGPRDEKGDGGEDGERFEVLVRMRDDDGTLVPPGYFLGAAERNDLMPALDRSVVALALRRLAADPARLAGVALCTVNLSARTLADATFVEHVAALLDQTGVPPSRLCFEIGESAVLANLPRAQRFIERLRSLGCHCALEHFATGMGSFAYLRQLPVDYVKIDGSFVESIADSPVDAEVVRAINDVSHAMGKRTIAEFVASRPVMALLERIGVDYAQGHWIGQPIDFADAGAGSRAVTTSPG